MAGTASALVDQIRLETNWTGGTDTQVLFLLNRVHLRVQREHDFSWMEQVSQNTLATNASVSSFARYSQPTDAKSVAAIYYIESNKRITIPSPHSSFFAAINANPDSSKAAKPVEWNTYRDEIYIFPQPNSALLAEIYYYRYLPDLTLTAQNNFVAYAEDALFYGAVSEYQLLMGEDQKAQIWQQREVDAVESILKYQRGVKERLRTSSVPNTPGRIG